MLEKPKSRVLGRRVGKSVQWNVPRVAAAGGESVHARAEAPCQISKSTRYPQPRSFAGKGTPNNQT